MVKSVGNSQGTTTATSDQNRGPFLIKTEFDAWRWTTGENLNIGFDGGDSFQRPEVKNTAKEWCEWANLEFVYDDTKPYDIFISFQPDESWSEIGDEVP